MSDALLRDLAGEVGLKPDWVASVTTVAGPTQGSEVADWFAALNADHPVVYGIFAGVGDLMGRMLAWMGRPELPPEQPLDLPQDTRASMQALTTQGTAAFNRRFPAGVPVQPCGQGEAERGGIRYYSWGTVGRYYNVLNPGDYLMSLSGLAFRREADNDGLVGRCSSHFGQVIRDDYPMNHFHSINQILGLVGPDAKPVALYVEHARRLKQAGL